VLADHGAFVLISIAEAPQHRRFRSFADLNLGVVHMRQHLAEVAHADLGPADRAIAEMIGFG
jgi:hypothetical protein